MKTKNLLVVIACTGLFAGCATVPNELVNAREVYQRASTGPAAQVAPAELHVAQQALTQAEQSFQKHPDSYQTRDLAYVAQRKSEIAEATASIAIEQKSQNQAKNDYLATQGKIVAKTKQDLSQTRAELVTSERNGEMKEERLVAEQAARTTADKRTVTAQAARNVADQRAANAQEERIAADMRTADAQAALARLAAVKEEPRGLVITLSGSVLFASGKYALLNSAMTKLDEVAFALKAQDAGKRMVVEGHTDSQGSDSTNQPLSLNRAIAVRDYLVSRGVAPEKITAVGLSSSRPITDNKTAENRANNRRVEIIIERESHTSNP